MQYEIFSVLAGAYPRGHKGAELTHAVVDGRPLCNRVKAESLTFDECEPSYQCNEGTPECPTCARKLEKMR